MLGWLNSLYADPLDVSHHGGRTSSIMSVTLISSKLTCTRKHFIIQHAGRRSITHACKNEGKQNNSVEG